MEKHIKQIEETVVKEVGGLTKTVEESTVRIRRTVFERFPFLIIGLSTFGLVAVFYSFERVITMVPVLDNNPLLLFTIGVLALAATGTLYKKLQ